MKKSILFLAVLFSLSFISCEPNSLSEDENNTTIHSVDRGEVEKPGDQGNTGG